MTNINAQPPEDIARVVKENTKPEIVSFQPDSLLLLPKGMEAKSIKPFMDEYREKPERREGIILTERLESFIDITNRFKNEHSALFASAKIEENKITAGIQTIFDYHPKGGDIKAAENLGHKVCFGFPLSKDFKFWLERNAKPMSQLDFALLLEERYIDMASPNDEDRALINGLKPKFAEPLEMLELSRDLELYSNETFQSKNKLSSGETELKFTAQHVDAKGAPVRIPDFFIVRMAIFEGGEEQRVIVRLRYRLNGGSIVWFYDLYRIDRTLEKAFETDCEIAQENTELPLYFGKPEA